MAKHYLIFIHGIGVFKPGVKSAPGYDKLWHLLIRKSGMTEQAFNEKFGRIDVMWHDNSLNRAANTIFDAAFPDLKQRWSLMRLIRQFMTVSAEVLVYASDVNYIRRIVWEQIWQYQDRAEGEPVGQSFKQLLEEGATYSIVAHSLGTTIAFDYLFGLFEEGQLFVQSSDLEAQPGDSELKPEEIMLLKDQFHHFFSMGSPIGLFLMRKESLWMQNETPFATIRNPIRGKNRVWYNFWDSDDPIAYPLEDLFDKNRDNDTDECNLLDIPVETGSIFTSHLKYWTNEQVATEIIHFLLEGKNYPCHPMANFSSYGRIAQDLIYPVKNWLFCSSASGSERIT